MKQVKLIMVTNENNNKYYNMIPKDNNTFIVEYGRVNCSSTVKEYSMNDFEKLYRSKIKKGYKDVTELFKEEVVSNNIEKTSDFYNIISRLQKYAKDKVNDNYNISSQSVTDKMIEEAQNIIDELVKISKINNVYNFNECLIKLFNILPRKMNNVKNYLLNKDDLLGKTKAEIYHQYNKIISREQKLLDTLQSTIIHNDTKQQKQDYLKSINLEMKLKDDNLEKQVKDLLGELQDKYVNCWYVSNNKTQEAYDNNIKSKKGIHKTEQLFWHGSRNENWLSILQNGMLIRPSGVATTGAMFGLGIYGANKARKSYGYTSAKGSYWASGNSSTAFMALFKFNTGKHHNVYKHTSECYDFNADNLKTKGNYDSVYAHKGADLRNDEFIVYNTNQVTIYALVELRG